MWWWICGGVVLVAVVAVVVLAGVVRRDLAELQRVADLARERTERAQRRLQVRGEQVQRTVLEVNARSAGIRRGLDQLRGGDGQ